MGWILVRSNGEVVNPGETLRSFRGGDAEFIGVSRQPSLSSTGKVHVRWADGGNAEYYPSVFGCEIRSAGGGE